MSPDLIRLARAMRRTMLILAVSLTALAPAAAKSPEASGPALYQSLNRDIDRSLYVRGSLQVLTIIPQHHIIQDLGNGEIIVPSDGNARVSRRGCDLNRSQFKFVLAGLRQAQSVAYPDRKLYSPFDIVLYGRDGSQFELQILSAHADRTLEQGENLWLEVHDASEVAELTPAASLSILKLAAITGC